MARYVRLAYTVPRAAATTCWSLFHRVAALVLLCVRSAWAPSSNVVGYCCQTCVTLRVIIRTARVSCNMLARFGCVDLVKNGHETSGISFVVVYAERHNVWLHRGPRHVLPIGWGIPLT